jgi:hypothetical protein
MLNPRDLVQYTRLLFERPAQAEQTAEVIGALWQAKSARLSDLARALPGAYEAAYKRLQRFLSGVDPAVALGRLFDAEAEFVIGDVTEVARPQAKKTAYVGRLKDGRTRGFDVLALCTPKRGRALPFAFVTYSSATLDQECTSRNQEHLRALEQVRALIGELPLLLDREWSYGEWLRHLVEAGLRFVIRLKVGNPQVGLVDRWGMPVVLEIRRGERKVYRDVLYQGTIPVHVCGGWEQGFREPVWLVTNVEPEEALRLYPKRMKIEQSFRDEKSRLGLDRLMSQRRAQMEKLVALVLLAYALGVWIGEVLRDQLLGPPDEAGTEAKRRKWHRYSGLFVLQWRGLTMHTAEFRRLLHQVFPSFAKLVQPPVRTRVRT